MGKWENENPIRVNWGDITKIPSEIENYRFPDSFPTVSRWETMGKNEKWFYVITTSKLSLISRVFPAVSIQIESG
jgi:hypothetical protein